MILYGIRNCDTVKKARHWLDAHELTHGFHDYKVAGVDPDRLRDWVTRIGWEPFLNRAGTTFRKLDPADTAAIDTEKAIALMLAHPSIIKRPVLEADGVLLVGFKPERYADAFG